MRATLIYNGNAGGVNGNKIGAFAEALHEAGYEPICKATSSEEELDPILENVEGLVIAAGGDGTFRAVASRLIGKDAALAALPMGTANNICNSLGVEGKPLELLKGLAHAKRCPLDVGFVRAPWGEDYFFEAMGFGIYADVLAAYDPNNGKSVPRAVRALAETLNDYEPFPLEATLDGEDVSGHYLLFEVLNTPTMGPRLRIAPDASPRDGFFEVVRLSEDNRVGFLGYVGSLLTDNVDDLPNVQTARGKKLELHWRGEPVHIDAEVRPQRSERPSDRNPAIGARPAVGNARDGLITVEILAGALEFWLPQRET